MGQREFIESRVLTALLLVVVIAVCALFAFEIDRHDRSVERTVEADLNLRLEMAAKRLEAATRVQISQTLALKDGVELSIGAAQSRGTSRRGELLDVAARALEIFIARIYETDQVRLLDMEGMELIRLQRSSSGEIIRVADQELQSKAGESYVKRFSALAPNTVGLSEVTPNVEFGAVELPLRPMLRSGALLDIGEERLMLVINREFTQELIIPPDVVSIGRDLHIFGPDGISLFPGIPSFADSPSAVHNRALLAEVVPAVSLQLEAGVEQGLVRDDMGLVKWQALPIRQAASGSDWEDDTVVGKTVLVAFEPYGDLFPGSRLWGAQAPLTWSLLVGGGLMTTVLIYLLQRLLLTALRSAEQINTLNTRLTKAYDELRETEGRKADLLAVIGHEVRSPLAGIAMLAEGSEQEWVESKPAIKGMLRTTMNMLDDLKYVASTVDKDGAAFENVSLGELLESALASVSPVAALYGIHINQPSSPDDRLIMNTNKRHLQGIVSNICRNACLHSGGSTVLVRAHLELTERSENAYLDIALEDDGHGIPQEARTRLFSMFERGETSAPGSGIGLAVVKDWTEGLGGSVEYFDSELGGAGFRIRVPVTLVEGIADAPPRAESQDDSSQSASMKGLTVLLVEDDLLILKLTTRMFEEIEARVLQAHNGREALKLLETERVDLVVTDNFMPVMSGLELVREARKQRFNIPLVIATAATIGKEQEQLLAAGATDVLAKPLRRDNLTQLLTKLGLNAAGREARSTDTRKLREMSDGFGNKALLGRMLRTSYTLFDWVSGVLNSGEIQSQPPTALPSSVLLRLRSRSESLGFMSLTESLAELQETTESDPIRLAALNRNLRWHLQAGCIGLKEELDRLGDAAAPQEPADIYDLGAVRAALESLLTSPSLMAPSSEALEVLVRSFGEVAMDRIYLALDLDDHDMLVSAINELIANHDDLSRIISRVISLV